MGYEIIKSADGTYKVWNTTTDSFFYEGLKNIDEIRETMTKHFGYWNSIIESGWFDDFESKVQDESAFFDGMITISAKDWKKWVEETNT